MASSKMPSMLLLLLLVATSFAFVGAHENVLPSYHYGAPIAVECMNRSS